MTEGSVKPRVEPGVIIEPLFLRCSSAEESLALIPSNHLGRGGAAAKRSAQQLDVAAEGGHAAYDDQQQDESPHGTDEARPLRCRLTAAGSATLAGRLGARATDAPATLRSTGALAAGALAAGALASAALLAGRTAGDAGAGLVRAPSPPVALQNEHDLHLQNLQWFAAFACLQKPPHVSYAKSPGIPDAHAFLA
eukprot:CAMPEP_0181225848 /NCGR_PEP_ID=MMETSP1096-20121128/31927_1 /TAXON_ID=156174 ORGANISM="Chrysochromulina ericina, Strain CCMP281" /NCGR_SAMPLE_ID=MMETSP1096 /ASSEMBLY_ACC=CAM_ASM_000453 /LENGTH=194 /DNA_ID=CAMNT_0023319121 /DNA_START=752 /DNA_END=1337 /DNA_ORIENTATION=-